VYWDDEFCESLAEKGHYVIRYDQRDVGRSVTYEPGTCQYSVVDLAADAIGVLDAYKVEKAHLVGMSLGGMISQIIAIEHPERVKTITMIASGSIEADGSEGNEMDPEVLDYHAQAANLDWADNEAVIRYLAKGSALLCGSAHVFDEKRAFKQAEKEVKRANNLLSMFNHALLQDDTTFSGSVKEIDVPALIIHGTEDSILSYESAIKLSKEIPDSKLLTLEGSGHEIHEDDWEQIITAIHNHTKTT